MLSHAIRGASVLPVIALVALAGCGLTAKTMGSQSLEGAVESLQRQVKEQPEEEQGVLAERMGSGAVRGAIQELSKPDNVDRLSNAVERGVASTLEQLATPRAPEGGGGSESPVGTLSREIGSGMSRAAIDELAARLAGSCGSEEPFTCLERRTHQLSRSVSAGVLQELWSKLHWPLLAAVFVLGVLLSAIVRQMARLAGVTFRRARGR